MRLTAKTLGKKRKWDDVAVVSDRRLSNGGSKRQHTGDQDASEGLGDELALFDDGDNEPEEEEVVGPSKVVFTTESLTLNLRISYIDFSGLHDKRSLQMLIPLIAPRKLILVSGTDDETAALAVECRKLLGAGNEDRAIDVFTPYVGIMVDASVDTNAWAVKLSDDLVKRLKWQMVKGLGVVSVTGRLEAGALVIEKADEEGSNKKQKLLEGGDASEDTLDVGTPNSSALITAKPSTIPILGIVPISMAAATRSVAQPLHVGDLRLADLRKLMLAAGHTAEFRGEGALLIDGSVAVRKMGTGRIEVESVGAGSSGFNAGRAMGGSALLGGEGGGTFWKVKRKIYEGLAVVAGG